MKSRFREIFRDYQEMSLRYDMENQAIWCYFNPRVRSCFSPVLLQEALQIQQSLISYFNFEHKTHRYPVRYLILASQIPGVFNFGGDLELFVKLIVERDRYQLLNYAKSCIDICYLNAVNLHLPLTTISLVEGDALGGGFESALSSNILIAEKQVEMGFPEIRFNLFPGMGAYTFLARALGIYAAEKMIASGTIYNATELYEMGLVNVLAETGSGEEAVNEFIRKHRRVSNGLRGIQAVKQYYNPITYEGLLGVVQIWVDAAMRLTDKDLRIMKRLVRAQGRRSQLDEEGNSLLRRLRTKQDRRFDSSDVVFPAIDNAGNQIINDRRKNADRRS